MRRFHRRPQYGTSTKDVSFILTRWIDLGPGLLPGDLRWRSLIQGEGYREVDAENMISSPRLRFAAGLVESGITRNWSDEELHLRNASLLKRREHMAVLEHCPHDALVIISLAVLCSNESSSKLV